MTTKQQEEVLLVFFCMLKTGTIRSKSNYFIGLIRSARDGSLTVPSKAETAAAKVNTPEQIAINKEADKVRMERLRHWSDYRWVQQQAIAENKSEEEVAHTMGMEKAYALFGKSSGGMEHHSTCTS